MEEIWKDIENYEGLYQISNLGRVKSLKFGKERIMKPIIGNKEYLFVVFHKDGKYKHHRIHRLVAQAFLSNPNNLPQVNHKDENKQNNSVFNLEWCDNKYNMNYGTRNERVAKLLSKQVYQYDKNMNLIKIWESTQECARNGFSGSHISECCYGLRKHSNGFIWSYEKRE